MKFKVEEYRELEAVLERERSFSQGTQRTNEEVTLKLQQKMIEL